MISELLLDKDFKDDERITHYTSAQGLYGILDSNCLWATHFQFLNDSKEFYAVRETLLNFVRGEIHKQFATWKVNNQVAIREGTNLGDLAAREAQTIVNALYTVTYGKLGDPFVLSGFRGRPSDDSYSNGSLLHWAMYGRSGGYAVRLNPHKIALLLEQERERYPDIVYRSGPVMYSADAPDKRFKADYEAIGKTAREMIEALLKDDLNSVDDFKAADPFWRVSSMLKDNFFRGESEARIVVMMMKERREGKVRHPLKVRTAGGVSIPYIELFKDILLGPNCPIETIIIGPHPEKERRTRALKLFLKNIDLEKVEVIESDVPYLG